MPIVQKRTREGTTARTSSKVVKVEGAVLQTSDGNVARRHFILTSAMNWAVARARCAPGMARQNGNMRRKVACAERGARGQAAVHECAYAANYSQCHSASAWRDGTNRVTVARSVRNLTCSNMVMRRRAEKIGGVKRRRRCGSA